MKIGIDIGGSHVAVGLVNENGEIIVKKEKNMTSVDRESIEKFIEENIAISVNSILKENGLGQEDIELIGIACPGTISNGRIVKSNNLGIYNLELVERLQRYFSAPISIYNDAKCAAICEKKYGALRNYDDAIYMGLGTGIGGAVFLGGNMLKPKKNSGMEIGHILIGKTGRQCTCGREGCFETYASMKNLRDRLAERLNLAKDLSGEILFELAKREIDKIDDIIIEFANDLVDGMTSLVNIFEPEAICIGGSYVYHTDILGDKVEEALKNAKPFNNEMPKIVLAEFQNDSGIVGSTLM